MKYEREKLIKIMNELVNFCIQIGMKDLDIKFNLHKDRGELAVSGYSENPPMERLKDLEEILNAPRQEELEEYYWTLVGEGQGNQELEMVGTLVDRGSVDYKDKILRIQVTRREI